MADEATEPTERVISVAQAAYERDAEQAARAHAITKAREALYGMEYDRDDVLAVADWLMTGTAGVALRMAELSHRAYRETEVARLRAGDLPSTDAATWSPTMSDPDTDVAPGPTRTELMALWDERGTVVRDDYDLRPTHDG